MLKFVVFVCLLCYSFDVTHPFSRDAEDSPTTKLFRRVRSEVWKSRETILANFEELYIGTLGSGDLDNIGIHTDESDDPETYDCPLCVAAISTLLSAIDAGYTFEDVRNLSIYICYNVTDVMGYDGYTMCPGLIDTFGPHVYYVLNVTTLSARQICEFHHECAGPAKETSQKYTARKQNRDELLEVSKPKNRRTNVDRSNLLKVAHITDVHVDLEYDPGAPSQGCNLPLCCRNPYEGQGIAGQYGEFYCNLPVTTLRLIMQHMAQQQPNLILYTGDSPCHAVWLETLEGQIEQNRIVTDLMKEYMPGVPAYFAEGNHDVYPTNLHYAYRADIQNLQTQLIQMWGDLGRFAQEQIDTVQKAAYFSITIYPGLKVISYNTNYGETNNFYGVLLPESEFWKEMVQHFNDSFNDARANNEKVILLGHHFMNSGRFDFYVETLNEIIDANGDLMVVQLYGHGHDDTYQMSVDENFDTTSVWISPATAGTRTEHHPSYKVYYMDPVTFDVVDADTFFLNITEANEGGSLEMKLLYNYLDEYNMTDLTAASFQDLTDRMVYDAELYDRYRYNAVTRFRLPGDCDDQCRYSDICYIRSTDDQRYSACMAQMPFP